MIRGGVEAYGEHPGSCRLLKILWPLLEYYGDPLRVL